MIHLLKKNIKKKSTVIQIVNQSENGRESNLRINNFDSIKYFKISIQLTSKTKQIKRSKNAFTILSTRFIASNLEKKSTVPNPCSFEVPAHYYFKSSAILCAFPWHSRKSGRFSLRSWVPVWAIECSSVPVRTWTWFTSSGVDDKWNRNVKRFMTRIGDW